MINYFNNYILKQKTTGMIAPSGAMLVDSMLSQADISKRKTVVELGTGTGVITGQIIKRINPNAIFFGLEINRRFIKETKNKYSDIKIYHDSAENIKLYLGKYGLTSCDCVISGLPWSYFNPSMQDRIVVNIASSLEKGGSFLTYAYLHGLVLPSAIRFKKLLKKNFKTFTQSKIIWKNLPPVIIYHAKN